MYARRVDDRTLTFGVSGMLWNQSVVLYDRETGSLWSHILGEAMQGPLRGTRLEQIPSVMTDWRSWSKQYPDSTVVALRRTSQEYLREFYQQPEQFVFGVVEQGQPKAWGFEQLRQVSVLNDAVGERPVVIAYDEASVTARMFDRRVRGRVLTFRLQGGNLVDSETASTWNPSTGQALAGPSAGEQLPALPAIVSYRKAWYQFHPDSQTGGGN